MTIVLERHDRFEGIGIMVRRHCREDFIRLDVDIVYNWGPIERRITPSEARQLAAALVALADEIEGQQ